MGNYILHRTEPPTDLGDAGAKGISINGFNVTFNDVNGGQTTYSITEDDVVLIGNFYFTVDSMGNVSSAEVIWTNPDTADGASGGSVPPVREVDEDEWDTYEDTFSAPAAAVRDVASAAVKAIINLSGEDDDPVDDGSDPDDDGSDPDGDGSDPDGDDPDDYDDDDPDDYDDDFDDEYGTS